MSTDVDQGVPSDEAAVPPGNQRPQRIVFVPGSHLDLYWLGSYQTCLDRGAHIIKSYLDRCIAFPQETFMIDSVVFTAEFLHRHPDYADELRRLLAEGRVDVSAAFVDRWENLVLAESIIRNVLLGKKWLHDVLGHDSRVALHPDLPGLNAQTPQLYRSSGVDFYASARKIFPEGRVWRSVAPDGTRLLMLRWPGHYNFVPLRLTDLPPELPRWGDWQLEFGDVDERFPLGTLPVSAIAGDLTEPSDFTDRYGRDLAEFIADYRVRLPDVDFGYSTPTRILAPYAEQDPQLAEVGGGIPSVWGVSADESVAFFRRSRRNEALLLAAETAAVIGRLHGRPLLPPQATTWGGVFDEDAFFARNDLIDPANGFDDLWRLHLFTQDHNGGGQEGALSSFQKRVRQQRLAEYCRQIVEHAVGTGPSGGLPTVFNPGWHTGSAAMVVEAGDPAYPAVQAWHDANPTATIWPTEDALGQPQFTVGLTALPSVGVHALTADDLDGSAVTPATVVDDGATLRVGNEHVTATIDAASGRLQVTDAVTAQSWGGVAGALGLLSAVPERGNDVTLETDEHAVVPAHVVRTEIVSSGPVAVVRSHQRLLDADWYVQVTVRPDRADVAVEVATRWPGTAGWQIRLGLLDDVASAQVAFGTPYHLTRWDDAPAQAGPTVRDEIAPTDHRAYREIQHWIQVERPAGCLVVATANPGVHLAAGTLSAVLMRTAASCGDPRFHWDNHGAQRWQFVLRAGPPDPGSAQLADELAARPVLVVGGSVADVELVRSTGDPVHLGAVAPQGDDTLLRVVNLASHAAHVRLAGPLLSGSVELVELDGRLAHREVSAHDGLVEFELGPWRVGTVRVRPLHVAPDPGQIQQEESESR